MLHEGTSRDAWFHFSVNDINKLIKAKHSDFHSAVKIRMDESSFADFICSTCTEMPPIIRHSMNNWNSITSLKYRQFKSGDQVTRDIESNKCWFLMDRIDSWWFLVVAQQSEIVFVLLIFLELEIAIDVRKELRKANARAASRFLIIVFFFSN